MQPTRQNSLRIGRLPASQEAMGLNPLGLGACFTTSGGLSH
jgi:hypothetical protein